MEKPKFNIGDDVYYVTSSCRHGVSVPCSICFGKLKVRVILGNGEHVDTECQHCAHGMNPPSGFSMTWEPKSEIHFGIIKGIRDTSEGWRYDIGYESVQDHEMFTSREDAVPLMERRLAEETERRKLWERDHFLTATKKQIWSAGYHRSCIETLKRNISWHEMRLCMIDDKSKRS
jgi:hypothetical protein